MAFLVVVVVVGSRVDVDVEADDGGATLNNVGSRQRRQRRYVAIIYAENLPKIFQHFSFNQLRVRLFKGPFEAQHIDGW